MKCLIVEDNELLRVDLRLQMHGLGYDCVEAASTSDALYYMKTHSFDLLLLDLLVKDGSSLSLVDYLQVTGSTATIIMITGSGAFPHGEHTRMAPRIDYVLRKPVNPRDLTALVEYTAHHAA